MRFVNRHIVLRLLAICLPFLLVEGSFRLYDYLRHVSPKARASWFWGFQQDRLLGFRARPHVQMTMAGGAQFDTNTEGFRDREMPVASPVPRHLIICEGESSTWGTGATNREHTWPRLLEQQLHHLGATNWLTLNAGMPAYTLIENLQLLQFRLLKYQPEVILYMGFRNDWVSYANKLETRVDLNFYPRTLAPLSDTFLNRLFMRSSAFAFCLSRVGARFPLDTQSLPPPPDSTSITRLGARVFRDQVALLALLCRRHAIRLIWVDQPINHGRLSTQEVASVEALRTMLYDELRSQDIPLVPAHNQYNQHDAPMLDDVHFSDAGNAQLANIIAPQVLNILNQDP